MHGDTKIGLALGILLVGIVGAFFFRNDESTSADVPQMKDAAAIDERISERKVGPYVVRRREMTRRPEQTVRRRSVRDPDDQDDAIVVTDDLTADADVFGLPDPIPFSSELGPVNGDQLIGPGEVPNVAQPNSQTREYVVQPNDTLSHLAERFLGGSSRYRDLYEMNLDRLSSPNDLRVGMKILVPTNGQSRILESIADRRDRNDERQPSPTVIERRIYIERAPQQERVVESERRRRKLVLQSIGSGQQ